MRAGWTWMILAVVLLGACESTLGPGPEPDPNGLQSSGRPPSPVIAGARLISRGTPAFCAPSIRPTFSWEPTGRLHVQAAVFSENIQVTDGSIENAREIVWLWHSGMSTGREGFVRWSDGIFLGAPQGSLTPGSSYVWAVWAWDDQGLVITDASPELFFTADESGPSSCRAGTLVFVGARWVDQNGRVVSTASVGDEVTLHVCARGAFDRIALDLSIPVGLEAVVADRRVTRAPLWCSTRAKASGTELIDPKSVRVALVPFDPQVLSLVWLGRVHMRVARSGEYQVLFSVEVEKNGVPLAATFDVPAISTPR